MNPIYNLQTPLSNPARDVILLCDSTHDSECQEYIYADINYARNIAKTLQENSTQIGRTKLQELWTYSSKHNKTAAPIYAYYALQDPNQDQSFYKVLVNGMTKAGYYTKHKKENPSEYDDPTFNSIDSALSALLEEDDDLDEVNNAGVIEQYAVQEPSNSIQSSGLKDLNLELETDQEQDLEDSYNVGQGNPINNQERFGSTQLVDFSSEEDIAAPLDLDLDSKEATVQGVIENQINNDFTEDIITEQQENTIQEDTMFDLDETLRDLNEEGPLNDYTELTQKVDTIDIKPAQHDIISVTNASKMEDKLPIKQIDTLDSLYKPITEEEIKKLTSEIDYQGTSDLDNLPIEKEDANYPSEWQYPLEDTQYMDKQYKEPVKVASNLQDNTMKEQLNQEDMNMDTVLSIPTTLNQHKESSINLDFVHKCLLNSTKIIEKAIEHNNTELFSILDTKMQNDIKQAILSKITIDSIKTLITEEFISSYKDEYAE